MRSLQALFVSIFGLRFPGTLNDIVHDIARDIARGEEYAMAPIRFIWPELGSICLGC